MADHTKITNKDARPRGLNKTINKGGKMPLGLPRSLEAVEVPEAPETHLEFGIDETLDAVDFAVSLVNAIVLAYEDGVLSLSDFQYAMAPFMKIPSVISGMDLIPSELGDLTPEEIQTLIDRVASELSIDNDKALAIVAKAIRLAYAIYEMVVAVKALKGDDTTPVPEG